MGVGRTAGCTKSYGKRVFAGLGIISQSHTVFFRECFVADSNGVGFISVCVGPNHYGVSRIIIHLCVIANRNGFICCISIEVICCNGGTCTKGEGVACSIYFGIAADGETSFGSNRSGSVNGHVLNFRIVPNGDGVIAAGVGQGPNGDGINTALIGCRVRAKVCSHVSSRPRNGSLTDCDAAACRRFCHSSITQRDALVGLTVGIRTNGNGVSAFRLGFTVRHGRCLCFSRSIFLGHGFCIGRRGRFRLEIFG